VSEHAAILPERSFRPLAWLARYLRERFAGVTRSEKWGYVVWSVVGAAIAVPEIWAAAAGNAFIWPTISGTVGHLEDRWAIVALVPVALLAGAALALGRFHNGVTLQADGEALIRTPEGRLAKAGKVELAPDKPVPEIVVNPSLGLAGRRSWSVLRYVLLSVAIISVCSLVASTSGNKWLTGYVLYSLIFIFGMVIPNALAYWKRRDVPFTTLLFTLRTLQRRLHLVAVVIAAGLMVLLLHLAIYPWPDLARDAAGYAGLTPANARSAATHALRANGVTTLSYSAEHRGVFNGRNAWFVYFLDGDRKFSGCVVVVAGKSAQPSDKCRASQ
jgi:hypothetical protein